MNRAASWCAVLLMSAPALAADPFEKPLDAARARAQMAALMPSLEHADVLRGAFTQRKFLRELPRPLLSTGEFVMLRGQGIRWHTLQPFESDVILRPGDRRPLPSTATDVAAKADPGAASASATALFFALLSLDIPALADRFAFFGDPSGPRWQLGLRPRDDELAARFEKALVEGGASVERVVLYEPGGDRTEIELHADARGRDDITDAERQLLAP